MSSDVSMRMKRKQEKFGYGLLVVVMLATITALTRAQDSSICDAHQSDCKACITADADCAWCGEVDKESTTPTYKKRCKTSAEISSGSACPVGNVSNPTSSFTIEVDQPITVAGPNFFKNESNVGKTVIQMRPQEITVRLRPGHPIKFTISFEKVIDYPLDLYYVMDLSNSMKDDLQILQQLGTKLFSDIEANVTENVQLGFGSFVDKVMMPFASTVDEQLQNPCAKLEEDNSCAPAFAFRHQVNITNDQEAFAQAIRETKISGNIDSPEGSFDALMQIAVCEDIQWRRGATHVILLTTDASPHIALDGKLAAILEANDMQCHLEWGANSRIPEALVNSKSKVLDYPSVGQLKKVFGDNKIHSIFAVTEVVYPLYEPIKRIIENSYVAILKEDSSNIIPLIAATYNELKGRLELSTPEKPEGVELTYKVYCPNGTHENSLRCDDIEIGDEVKFEFEITATSCPSTDTVDQILLKSSSLQDEVKINIEYVCDCKCSSEGETKSDRCNNLGSLTCGVCACDPGREGTLCQCNSTANGVDVSEACKRRSSEEIYCGGNGECECGTCRCNEPYFGTHCECKTTGCGSNKNGICGGSDNGDCNNCDNNNECKCKNGYTVKPTDRTCSCHTKSCMQDQTLGVVCSDRGTCSCDTCVCTEPVLYRGEFCETCKHPNCTGLSAKCASDFIRRCAICLNEKDYRGDISNNPCSVECGNSFLTYEYVSSFLDCDKCDAASETPECTKCEKHSEDNVILEECTSQQQNTECKIHYQVAWLVSDRFIVYVKRFNKDEDCPKPVDPMTIVLPVVGSIILIGLVALITWKIITTLRDKHQYEEFLKEEKNRKWTKGENPIFAKPSSNFANPTFAGNAD